MRMGFVMDLRRLALVIGLALAAGAGGCSDSGSGSDRPLVVEPPPEQASEDPDPPDPEPPPGEPQGAAVTLEVDDVTIHEGDGPLTFIVRAEGGDDADAVVDFSSVDGSAVAGSDYVAVAGTLEFVGDATEQTVTVEIVDDDQAEATETFSLELGNPLNATIAKSTAIATILDDDPPDGAEPPPVEAGRYNIVVLYTDDQRFDTLDMTIDGVEVMPNVQQRLLPAGVKFANAYTPIPLCCPARASTYSGGFLAQDTGVLENNPPNGGTGAFVDGDNIGVRLQQAGYRTMFIGKWFNDYPNHAPYVPPGWDAFVGRAVWATGARWDRFEYVFGSTGRSSGVGEKRGSGGEYQANFERDRIIEFIEQAPDDTPYLVFWSSTAPHLPAIADAQDRSEFSDFRYRGRAYNEDDLSDKPRWVTSPRRPIGSDEEVRSQLRSLRSLDRAFGGVLDAITARGELEETVFIVTSDNGYLWGEHGVWSKTKPYEESVRVPLLVVVPGMEPRTDEHLVSAILDLGPTLYEIAGARGPSQGRSLLPLLRDPSVSWREELFFESYGTNAISIWAGLRRGKWKYVRYWYGEEELYDLEADPFELENRAGDAALEPVRAPLARRLEGMLGLAIHPVFGDTDGRVGQPYRLVIKHWGGEPPFEWRVESGQLPPGLRLARSTGEIVGTPSRRGQWTFQVRVTGSATAAQAKRRQTYVSGPITITIG